MRGIIGWGTHVPYRRLDRAEIAPVAGTGGGKGTRSVASYDEDSTTMGVEAARAALRAAGIRPRSLWFTSTSPAYLDKTNATAVHAALRLDRIDDGRAQSRTRGDVTGAGGGRRRARRPAGRR